MAAHSIGPETSDALDGEEPGRDKVIALCDRRAPVTTRRREADVQGGASATIHWFGSHFTKADQATLDAWARDTSHGYDRLQVERGLLEDGRWTSYALAYVPGEAWSTWGVMRRDDHVEVWRCSTGKTFGRHARMADALASLPHATEHRRTLPIHAGGAGFGSRQRERC